jgi:hypothetical protein
MNRDRVQEESRAAAGWVSLGTANKGMEVPFRGRKSLARKHLP